MEKDQPERFLRTKAIWLFLFKKESFNKFAVQYGASRSTKGAFNPAVAEERIPIQTNHLHDSYLRAFKLVIGFGILFASAGFIAYRILGVCPVWLSAILQIIGVGTILWATLWEFSWHERPTDAGNLPALVHQWLFNFMYSIGSGLFFFAYIWSVPW